mgnify:CR=1 FL=1
MLKVIEDIKFIEIFKKYVGHNQEKKVFQSILFQDKIMNENYVFSLYYTKKIKADLMFLDVGNVETYERILSKLNKIYLIKFLFFILNKQI